MSKPPHIRINGHGGPARDPGAGSFTALDIAAGAAGAGKAPSKAAIETMTAISEGKATIAALKRARLLPTVDIGPLRIYVKRADGGSDWIEAPGASVEELHPGHILIKAAQNTMALSAGDTLHVGFSDEGPMVYVGKIEPRKETRIMGLKPSHLAAMSIAFAAAAIAFMLLTFFAGS